MTVATEPRAGPSVRGYVRPIAVGLLVLATGVVPWLLLSQTNARIRPDLPWAALLTTLYLALLLLWLNGAGPPRSTAAERRRRLRLWPREPGRAVSLAGTAPLLAGLALLYVLWIVMAWFSPVPDVSAYTTTSYRWSMFITGGVISGVVEEAAFRGYMQSGLERHDPGNALWIMSLAFALSHITQGVGAVLVLGPGMFVAAMLYGLLARRTGTIVPGMVIHVLGDLAHVYFGVLRGDGGLLFVP